MATRLSIQKQELFQTAQTVCFDKVPAQGWEGFYTKSPLLTSPVFMAAPMPAITPQPSRRLPRGDAKAPRRKTPDLRDVASSRESPSKGVANKG